MSTTTQRPTPEVNTHRDEMNHYEFDEELALTYELAKRLECERDEAREQLEAVREAIKEAYEALDNCIEFINDAQIIEAQWHWEPVKQSKAALAKLQPFIKP